MNQICLNGWWDIAPVSTLETFPHEGDWIPEAYLVPSPTTSSPHAVKAPGENWYRNRSRDPDAEVFVPENEFLFNTHGYPVEWGACPAVYARRTLDLTLPEKGKRLFLKFEAIAATSAIWLNGKEIARHGDAFLPIEVEMTEWVLDGVNELMVGIFDYPRDPDDQAKSLIPCGNMLTMHLRGIWQDAWLVERGPVFVEDVFIQTSVRQETLSADIQVNGNTDDVALKIEVTEWKGDVIQPVYQGPASPNMCLNETWQGAELWEPENPHLYELRFTFTRDGQILETSSERFGFREVWWDGPDLLLNGHPVHMFSDWGHKVTCYHHTEEWNRQWFRWMKENNINHTRFHTHPHPKLVMDLADEYGILVTGETGIHGSDGRQAADCETYWKNAREHVRDYVRRDRNHPSLVLWSVENEMRWNQDRTDKTREELPKLYDWFRELDPTREAYHEGDSTMWDESGVTILSRHYGIDCSGIGWWKQEKPLHSGEMASYHYMCPTTNFHTGNGDALWEDYAEIVHGAARESSMTIEAGRTTGVCNFGPWNLSCLVNLRYPETDLRLDPGDVTTPGVKPLIVPAFTSEFPFWEQGGKPIEFVANPHQKEAFRPFALIDLSHRRAYFSGQTVSRSVWLVNDTSLPQTGSLNLSIQQGQKSLIHQETAFDLKQGERIEIPLHLELPEVSGPVSVDLLALSDTGAPLDSQEQEWTLYSPEDVPDLSDLDVFLIGEGPSESWLDASQATLTKQSTFAGPLEGDWDLVVLEAHTIEPGSEQTAWLSRYVAQGGRVLVLEQHVSLFDGSPLIHKSCLNGFVRSPDHAAMKGLSHADVGYWGEEAFADLNSDAAIVHNPYLKNETLELKPLVDCGVGGFGLHLLAHTAIGEYAVGSGRLIASQLRFTDKAAQIPECRKIFFHLISGVLSEPAVPAIPALEINALQNEAIQQAEAGADVLLHVSTPEEITALGEQLNLPLRGESEEHYQGIVRKSVFTEGLSNDDACGVNSFTYCFGETSWPVASCHLSPQEKVQPLIETPCKSLIKEFFVQDQRTEALRAYNASKLYDANAKPAGSLLARIPVGKGALIVSTLSDPANGNPRVKRVLSRIRLNLGLTNARSLSRERVPLPEVQGTGTAPTWLTTSLETAGSLDGNEITTPTGERLAPTGAFRLAEWTTLDADSASQTPSPFQAYYTCFLSPRARRIELKDSGIPDPKSLTFLDITATSGDVQVYLNGHDLGTQSLKEEGTSYPDLELEAGFNQLMIVWNTTESDGSLRHHFRNIMNESETELLFLLPQKKDGIIRWTNAE